jgi:hypothetical protein
MQRQLKVRRKGSPKSIDQPLYSLKRRQELGVYSNVTFTIELLENKMLLDQLRELDLEF